MTDATPQRPVPDKPGFIQHVAVWCRHKETGVIRCIEAPWPARHGTIINLAAQFGWGPARGDSTAQGFVVDGKYLNREEAAKHALATGQIAALKWPPHLYSEDLW